MSRSNSWNNFIYACIRSLTFRLFPWERFHRGVFEYQTCLREMIGIYYWRAVTSIRFLSLPPPPITMRYDIPSISTTDFSILLEIEIDRVGSADGLEAISIHTCTYIYIRATILKKFKEAKWIEWNARPCINRQRNLPLYRCYRGPATEVVLPLSKLKSRPREVWWPCKGVFIIKCAVAASSP